MIPVNLELVNELWLPNIFIYNLKTFKVGVMMMMMMMTMMMVMMMHWNPLIWLPIIANYNLILKNQC